MVGSQMIFGGNGVEKVKGRQHGSNRGGTKMGSSTNVVGNEFVQENREGVKEKGKEVAGVFGYQGVEISNKVGGSSSVECREDLEGGGGWTLVTKKKAKPPKQKYVGKPRGIPGPGRRLHGGGDSGRGKGGALGLEPPLMKPMLVYKRIGNSSSGPGMFSASKCMCPLDEVVGNPGLKSVNLKRPKGRSLEAAGSSGGEVGNLDGGELGEVAGGTLVVYSPASPSSPVEEGVMKRRRGGDDSLSGGDASPLVIP